MLQTLILVDCLHHSNRILTFAIQSANRKYILFQITPETFVTLKHHSSCMHDMVGNIRDLELLTLFYFHCLILLLLFHLDIFWCPVRLKGPWSWVLLCVCPNVWSQACIKWISSVLVGSDFSIVNVHSTDSFICHSLAIFYSQLCVWWCLFSCTSIWHHGTLL